MKTCFGPVARGCVFFPSLTVKQFWQCNMNPGEYYWNLTQLNGNPYYAHLTRWHRRDISGIVYEKWQEAVGLSSLELMSLIGEMGPPDLIVSQHEIQLIHFKRRIKWAAQQSSSLSKTGTRARNSFPFDTFWAWNPASLVPTHKQGKEAGILCSFSLRN